MAALSLHRKTQLDKVAPSDSIMTTAPDTHVSLTVTYTVPEGAKAEDYTSKFYAGARACNSTLYYGYATNGNTLMCRQGYQNAEDFFAYLKEVYSCQPGDGFTIIFSGPKEELDKIRPKMTGDIQGNFTFAKLDGDNMLLGSLPESTPDTHVTILPEFTVPKGKMEEFKAGFEKFYNASRNGTKECLYYGFAEAGDKVWCREGYNGAQGVLDHLTDVKEPLDEALKIVGEGGLKLYIIGPATELEKLRPALSPIGAVFWELDSQAFWQ